MLWLRVASAVVVMVLVWLTVSEYQSTYVIVAPYEIEQIQRSFQVSSIVAAIASAIAAVLFTWKNAARVVLVGFATLAGFLCLWILWEPVVSQVWIYDGSYVRLSTTWKIKGAVTGAALMTLLLDAMQIRCHADYQTQTSTKHQEKHVRRFLFRLAATVLGALFIWAFAAGWFNAMTPLERAMTLGMGIVFLLYGLAGEGVADAILRILFGATAQPTENQTQDQQPELFDEHDAGPDGPSPDDHACTGQS